MSTGSFDSSIEGRKEKSRTPCSSRGFCLFVLSVVVCFVILYQSLVVHTGEGKIFLLDKALAYERVKKRLF